MLVSLKWLRDYIDLPDDIDVDELAHRLTMASAEVEAIHRVGGWDRALVTVGEVLAIDPHPNADRLTLATVRYASDGEPQQVICGAPNVQAGQRIAFARAGAELIDPRTGEPSTLQAATIRGVESAGMVLSERELGLSDEHEGILVLPADAPIGMPLAGYLGDTVLDVHIWPNRADTMSMAGIARELAAILDRSASMPDDAYEAAGPPVGDAVSVAIEDAELCARYIATLIEGVRVGPSPQWMQDRLRAAGMRPISNVVDVTNYVMLELGQPLHAFDYGRVEGAIGVRLARAGERLTTLDGEDRALSPDTLLITDGRGPIALAGVMGGASTEVTAETTAVLLEAATFEPASIRRTSTRLRLRSEASSRFERGLSPELAAYASRRATKLFVEHCGGVARAGAVDAYPRPHVPAKVTVTRSRLDSLIGVAIPDGEVAGSLEALGFAVERRGGDFVTTPPWWRTDIAIADDVIEEVVRIAGYDRLPATTLRGRVSKPELDPINALRDRMTDALVDAGMQEIVSYSLTTRDVLARVVAPEELAIIRPLRVRNTLSADRELLRPSLRHSLLEAVERNVRAGAQEVPLFEVARVYLPRHEDAEPLPEERMIACGAIAGVALDRWGGRADRVLDFFDAKGVIETALGELGVALGFAADSEYALLDGRVARLSAGGEPVGVLGEVHPETLALFDIDQPVMLFEVDLAALLPHVPDRLLASSVPRFPAVEQDVALVVDGATPAGALQATIEQSRLVERARIFDVYRGDQLPPGKKSVAFAISYRAADRTLTAEEANAEQNRIMRRLRREFEAELRS